VVEPLLDHVGLAGRLVARAGSAAQRARWLPGDRRLGTAGFALDRGRRYALAPQGHHRPKAGDGWVLNGEKCVVIGAASADAAGRVGAQPAATAPACSSSPQAAGRDLTPYRSVDGQRAADVRLDGVQVGADALLGAAGRRSR
jgi:alkylation response protein AidB-like acyl-CoA dehydrogenase